MAGRGRVDVILKRACARCSHWRSPSLTSRGNQRTKCPPFCDDDGHGGTHTYHKVIVSPQGQLDAPAACVNTRWRLLRQPPRRRRPIRTPSAGSSRRSVPAVPSAQIAPSRVFRWSWPATWPRRRPHRQHPRLASIPTPHRRETAGPGPLGLAGPPSTRTRIGIRPRRSPRAAAPLS